MVSLTSSTPAGMGMHVARSRRAHGGRDVDRAARLLAALLDVGADEVLGVLLEHVVDLVEDRVDVLAELLPPLLAGRRGVRVPSSSSPPPPP